jgi:transposase
MGATFYLVSGRKNMIYSSTILENPVKILLSSIKRRIMMAFKFGNNRDQATFLPPVMDDYVGPNDPVRVYDAFIDALDFGELGISLIPKAGAERYEPRKMLKLIVYGTSYGDRSSRKLERACRHNLSYLWLMNGLQPDYRTIIRFRSDHKEAITKVLKQCVRMCVQMDLIEGNTLFLDGSKFRANASIAHTLNREDIEQELTEVERHIDELMAEAERLDQAEDGLPSLVETQKKIEDRQQLADRMKDCLALLESEKRPSVNWVDPDSVKAKSRQGTHAMHNVQCVTDDQHGLIVQAEAVGEPNDNGQLLPQLKQAIENIGRSPEAVGTDSGYFNPAETKGIEENITVVMPSPQQTNEEKNPDMIPPGPFDKSHFQYDKERDVYICPEGKILNHQGVDSQRPHRHIYRADAQECNRCPHHGLCTSGHSGRKVIRSEYEDIIRKQEAVYASQRGQAIYQRRKQKAELPFGHWKRNLCAGQFLLRGRQKVNAEVSVLATCFNLARMITIVGAARLIAALRGI